MKLISLVIPCYNEEKGIGLLYKTVLEALRPLEGKAQMEFRFVDDGSHDGTLDAILTDSVLAYYFIYTSEEQYYVLSDSLGEEGYAIGFRKDDRALRDRVQEIIDEMGADGTLGEISQKWFGADITIVR